MQKHLKHLAIAAIAAGSYGFLASGHWLFAEQKGAGGTSGSTGANVQQHDNMAAGQAATQLPPGIQHTQKDDSEDIRSTLGDVTESAVTQNNLDNLVGYFVDADRNRIGDAADRLADEPTLNGRIAQLQKDWQAKYNQKLNIDPNVAFGQQFQGFVIVQGEITNPNLLSNWPVQNQGAVQAGQAGQMGQGEQAGQANQAPSQTNLQQGREVAIVTFPASHGLPEVNVSMIHERPDQWRIDIPDNLDAQKLHDNLLTQLTSFNEQKAQWPNDVNEASRLVTHRIMMAVYGVQAGQGGAQPQRMMIQPQDNQSQQGGQQQGQ